MVAQLTDYESHPFSERELAALRYADALYFDHHGITDEDFARLRTAFSEPEVVELTWVIVQFIALGKLISVFGIPYGEGTDADVPLGYDTAEGPST